MHAVVRLNVACQPLAAQMLDLHQTLAEMRILDKGEQPVHLLGVAMPSVRAKRLVDQGSQLGVCPHQPAAVRDAVRLVVELARRILVEVMQRRRFEDVRVDLCHTVDAVPADNGEPRHVHDAVLDDGEGSHLLLVARITAAHLLEVATVDFVDDHVDAREQRTEHIDIPRLECLRHDRVVRIGDGVARNCPRILPRQFLIIDQHTHQLCHAECRMRIVDMDADLPAEVVDAHACLLVVTDNALYACRDEEILLNEAHPPPLERAVIGVEIARD